MKQNEAERFEKGDRVMVVLDAPKSGLMKGVEHTVETCLNGSTTLVNVEEPVATEQLEEYPENIDSLIEFAINIVGAHLVSVPEGARIAQVGQVYFRNLINRDGDYALPNPLLIEILGKQFVKRAYAEGILKMRTDSKAFAERRRTEAHQARQIIRAQIDEGLKPEPVDIVDDVNDDGRDSFEECTVIELKEYARQIPSIKINQSKKKLIAALRAHRAANV